MTFSKDFNIIVVLYCHIHCYLGELPTTGNIFISESCSRRWPVIDFGSLLELLVELLLCTRHFAGGWESTDEQTNQVPDLLGVFELGARDGNGTEEVWRISKQANWLICEILPFFKVGLSRMQWLLFTISLEAAESLYHVDKECQSAVSIFTEEEEEVILVTGGI